MIFCDTNIFFELFKGNDTVIDELLEIGYDNLAICDVTVFIINLSDFKLVDGLKLYKPKRKLV
jgi:predicted nucleic acid-binding protein